MTVELQDKLYTSTQVADILGVSLRTLYRYMEDGRIGSMRTASGRHRFTKQNIVDFLNAGGFEEYNVAQKAPQNREPSSFGYQERHDTFRSEQSQYRNEPPQYPSNDRFDRVGNVSANTPSQPSPFDRFNRELPVDRRFDAPVGESARRTEPQTQRDFVAPRSSSFDTPVRPTSDMPRESSFFDSARRPVSEFNMNRAEELPTEKKNMYFEDDKINDDFDFKYDAMRRNDFAPERPVAVIDALEKESRSYEPEFQKEKISYQPFMSKPEPKEISYTKETPYAAPEKFDEQDWNFSRAQQPVAQDRVFEKPVFSDRRPAQPAPETVDLSYGINIRYYKSDYTDLIELARKIKEVAKSRDLEYAFTLFAGLSLHFLIKPFTLLHFYANPEDMQIWKDDLKLVPANKKDDANIGIIVNTDIVFVPTKEISGFKVVEDKVLTRDLTDVREDDLARQFKQHLSA